MVNWHQIETVLLDMDGTLLDLKFDNEFWQIIVPKAYAVKEGLTVEQAVEKLAPLFKQQEGLLNWYCLDYWTEQLGLNIAELKQQQHQDIQVLPYTRDFLLALHATGKRCVLVTNAHFDSLGLKMKKTGLIEFFDGVVSSHDLGYPKEHPEFWRLLQVIEQFDKQTTLMVDDSLSVLEAADKHGIAHLVLITHPDSSLPVRNIEKYTAVKSLREISP